MEAKLKHVFTSITIEGLGFPVSAFNVTLANQGTMGVASASGPLSSLMGEWLLSGLDIIEASNKVNGCCI